MPSTTSTIGVTPPIFTFSSARPPAAPTSLSSSGVLREQLDDDRLGRAGQVADHVLQHLNELHVEHRLRRCRPSRARRRSPRRRRGSRFASASPRCRRCSARSPRRARVAGRCGATCSRLPASRAGSPRRGRARGSSPASELPGRHDVVEDEAAFVHRRQQIASRVRGSRDTTPPPARRTARRASGCRSDCADALVDQSTRPKRHASATLLRRHHAPQLRGARVVVEPLGS